VHEVVDAAARDLRRAHAGERGRDVELELAVREVAPCGDQDLVRQNLLHFPVQPLIDRVVPADERALGHDAHEARAFLGAQPERRMQRRARLERARP
jgi:hypothetical protein